MTLIDVMSELEALGSERIKNYMSNGAHDPLFGLATGAMKSLFKKIKINQQLARSSMPSEIMMPCILQG